MSRVIKSNDVGSSVSTAKSIPFRPINLHDSQSEDTLAWTVHLARKESAKLLTEAKEEAAATLDNAHTEANSVLNDVKKQKESWQEEKNLLQKQAYEEAFSQGYEEGREKGYSDLFHSIEEAKKIVESAKEALQDHLEHNEHVILELAMKASERIIAGALEDDPDKYLAIVKRGIKEAREMREIKVFVALAQFQQVHEERDELLAMFPVDVQLYIYPEEELEPYQCFIESNQGRIDISIDTQLAEMKKKLSELLGDAI